MGARKVNIAMGLGFFIFAPTNTDNTSDTRTGGKNQIITEWSFFFFLGGGGSACVCVCVCVVPSKKAMQSK